MTALKLVAAIVTLIILWVTGQVLGSAMAVVTYNLLH